MGPDGSGNKLLAIEVDRENISKDLTALDIPLPILRPEWWRAHTLAQWVCNEFAFVDEDGFQTHRPKSFSQLLIGFKEYKSATV